MQHQIRNSLLVEEGDCIKLYLRGSVTVSESKLILDIVEKMIARYGRYGVSADLRELTELSPEVRRYVASWTHGAYCFGNAIIGASFAIRTLVSLLMRARDLFQKQSYSQGIAFFKTEEEAWTWLQQRREKRLAETPAV